jgi:hypothetical protein
MLSSEHIADRPAAGQPLDGRHSPDARLDALAGHSEALARHVARNLGTPPEDWLLVGHFLAELVAAPDGETEYTDARYWLRRSIPLDDLADTDAMEVEEDPWEHADNRVITATNLPEILAGTHTLPVGSVVHVFEFLAGETTTHVFTAAPSGMVVFKVHSHAAGGGKYQLTILTGAATSVLTGNVAMPEGLTVDADNSALGINMAEHGSSGHAVAVDTYGLGTIVGRMSDGKPIVMFSPGGGAIAVYNETVLLKAAPSHIKIPASCSQVLEFVEDPADTAGVLLRIKTASTYAGIWCDAGTWKLGYMRLHA